MNIVKVLLQALLIGSGLLVGQALGQPEVVVFLGVDCPLAKLYALRLNDLHGEFGDCVSFTVVNVGDEPEKVVEFGQRLRFPIVTDSGQAEKLQATRSPEAFLLDGGRVRYQGRIDDEYAPGSRGTLRERHLADAIESLLAGREIAVPFTEPVGCRLPVEVKPVQKMTSITYRDVAPIINKHCIECHRPGQVGPFDLTNYNEVSFWAPTIAEVVDQGRMPPWSADPEYGHFANDRSLPAADRKLLLDWIESGAAEGAGDLPPAPKFPEDWQIGKPDLVLSMPVRKSG